MDSSGNSSIQFRLPKEQKEQFMLACRENNVTASSILKDLVSNYVSISGKPNESTAKSSKKTSRKKTKRKLFTIGEMYCGPGGIGLAAKNSGLTYRKQNYGFTHSWATDHHGDTCMTYKNNIVSPNSKCQVIHSEIQELKLKKLPLVDGFLYGFPCNDFSNVGESKGLKGKFGPLYSYGVNYINYANPKFIFAENVSGIASANSGQAFKKILAELSQAGKYGYDLTAHLYKFEEYGIPQARHRYIVVGFRKDLRLKFKVPKPDGNIMTARMAIERPPIPADAPNQELTKQSQTVVERLKHIRAGENAWTADLPKHLQLNVKGARMSMIYKRLDPNKPAYTVTGSGGGGTHVYHWSEPRALTNRERARLQTFPDDFNFFGSKESVRRQIGMAVPVKGVQIILEAVLKTFAGKTYPYVEQNINLENQLDLI